MPSSSPASVSAGSSAALDPEAAPALKFAVVREDPEVECALVTRFQPDAVLTVASGGCTALTLAARFPGLRVTAFDVNPTQLAHVEDKLRAVAAGDLAALNVDSADPRALNQRGAFEALFRVLRQVVVDLVTPAAELDLLLDPSVPAAERAPLTERLLASPYWPAAFTTAFNDGLLHAMFGPAATQHARPGSYPGYFQAAFARGLTAPGAARNPFLQHVLLGRYRREDAPGYVQAARALDVELVEGTLLELTRLERHQLYSLSNVFDWSDDALVAAWAEALLAAARPGSVILIRQLNNRRDVARFFMPGFAFDDQLGRTLVAMDRSLFYERVLVGVRQ
jgi:S-adenosylmethionine-diacylglycerol 3-amino-3-carboxypropyl transferase